MKTRLLLCAAIVGLLASLAIPWLRPDRVLIDRWTAELATLPDDEVPLRLRQVAGLGREGLAVLVHALDDPRELVSATALQVINEQLDRWQTLESRVSSGHVAHLARLLAVNRRTQGPAARQASGELATRILLWPIDRQRVDGARMVLDCELVLRAAHASPAAQLGAESGPNAARHEAAGPGQGATDRDAVAAHRSQLPLEISAQPLPQRSADRPRSHTAQQLFPAPAPPVSYSPPQQSRLPGPRAAARASQASPNSSAAVRQSVQQPRASAVFRDPASGQLDVELMQQLHHADPSVHASALRSLRQRGYRAVHLNIARQVFHPDARERSKLIESLPRIPGVDPRPWLLQLSRDADPDLRRRVVAILATANDPVFRERLEEMARKETDARTAQLARQALHR